MTVKTKEQTVTPEIKPLEIEVEESDVRKTAPVEITERIVLEKVQEKIADKKNWCQGTTHAFGRYCTLGAFNSVVKDLNLGRTDIARIKAWQNLNKAAETISTPISIRNSIVGVNDYNPLQGQRTAAARRQRAMAHGRVMLMFDRAKEM